MEGQKGSREIELATLIRVDKAPLPRKSNRYAWFGAGVVVGTIGVALVVMIGLSVVKISKLDADNTQLKTDNEQIKMKYVRVETQMQHALQTIAMITSPPSFSPVSQPPSPSPISPPPGSPPVSPPPVSPPVSPPPSPSPVPPRSPPNFKYIGSDILIPNWSVNDAELLSDDPNITLHKYEDESALKAQAHTCRTLCDTRNMVAHSKLTACALQCNGCHIGTSYAARPNSGLGSECPQYKLWNEERSLDFTLLELANIGDPTHIESSPVSPPPSPSPVPPPSPPSPPPAYTATSWYGKNAYLAGTVQHSSGADNLVCRIDAKSTTQVDGIRLGYCDGSFSSYLSLSSSGQWSTRLQTTKTDPITRVTLKTGDGLDSITFYTSNGQSSGRIGGTGGDNYADVSLPVGLVRFDYVTAYWYSPLVAVRFKG